MRNPENLSKFRSILNSWRNKAFNGSNNSRYVFVYKLDRKGVLTIFSNNPGFLIGYKGELISKYSQELEQLKEIKKVKIEEISLV